MSALTHEEESPTLGQVNILVEKVQEYAIFTVDRHGRVASWNEGARLMKGYSPEETIGKPFSTLFTEEDARAGLPEKEMEVAAREGRYEGNGKRRRKDGSIFDAHVVLTACRHPDGTLEGYLKITRDITREMEAKARAEAERKRLEAILERIPLPVVLLEAGSGTVLSANRTAHRDLGSPDKGAGGLEPGESAETWLAGQALFDSVGRRLEAADNPVLRAVRGEPIPDAEVSWERHGRQSAFLINGGELPATAAHPQGLILAFQDITRLKESEDRLRQAQKMEAIGRLAGGVAHDFNNLLTAIRGYADLIGARMPAGDANRTDLSEIQKAAERAATLTNQLLTFSRKQIVAPADLDVNEVVHSMERMLHRLIGEDIEIVTRLVSEASHVVIDRGQLEQIIFNLALNSKDAMPEGGRLLIATEDVLLDAGDVKVLFPAEPGEYVRLSVTDEGTGIPEDAKPHIFEPFFTTKGVGKGTGLGLSTLYAIVRQNRGNLALTSAPGRGTTFCVYLPRAAPAPARPAVPEETGQEAQSGARTLVLVEDEQVVRILTTRILEAAGYRVLAAENGATALDILRDLGAPPDLLITDVVMPGMNGRELMEEALRLYPDLKGLFMSGYTDDEVFRRGVQSHGLGFIGKPFGAKDLLAKVRSAMQAPAPA